MIVGLPFGQETEERKDLREFWEWWKAKGGGLWEVYTPEETLYEKCGELSVGDRGKCVVTLQAFLFWQGYYSRLFPDASYEKDVDGFFGPRTEAAVKLFQKEMGLPQTGVVDWATWDAIDRLRVTKREVYPAPPYPVPFRAEIGFEKYLPYIMLIGAGILAIKLLKKPK